MSEVTTKERVTFEVVTQQNHIKELLDLPVASETPGLDALMNVPQHEREKQTQGRFEPEIGVTPLWYATRALGMYENPVFDRSSDAPYILAQYRRYEHRWRLDRHRAVREIQHRFYTGRMDRADARNALLEWELECVFTSGGVLVPVELIPPKALRQRHVATCMPSRALSINEYARVFGISPNVINASPARFRDRGSQGSLGMLDQSALHNERTKQ